MNVTPEPRPWKAAAWWRPETQGEHTAMPTDHFDYDATVAAIRGHFGQLAAHRFQLAALVRSALDHGARPNRLADDVGVHWHTLRKCLRVTEFWGDDRIPGTPTWSDYTMVFAYDYTDGERATIKARLLAGEAPQAVYAAARAERYRRRHQAYLASRSWLDSAETHLEAAMDCIARPDRQLSDPDQAQLQRVAELLEAIAAASRQAGVPVRLRRQLRAA